MLAHAKPHYTKAYGALPRKTRMRLSADKFLENRKYRSEREKECVEAILANLVAALLAEDIHAKPFGVLWAKNQRAFEGDPLSGHLSRNAIKLLQRAGYVEEILGFIKEGYATGRPTVLRPTELLRNQVLKIGPLTLFSSDVPQTEIWLKTARSKKRVVRPALERALRIINRVNASATYTIDQPELAITPMATTLTPTTLLYYINSPHPTPHPFNVCNDVPNTGELPSPLHAQFTYRRTFKRDLKSAGRFVAEWQNLKKLDRQKLCVGGEWLVELDYVAMHPTMLLHMAGLKVTGDVYDLGVPEGARKFVKKCMNVALNAKSLKGMVGAMVRIMSKEPKIRQSLEVYQRATGPTRLGATIVHVLEAIRTRYPAIGDKFFTSAWRELQYLESQISERVMLEFTQRGVPCLGLHDSFLVPESERAALQDAMIRHYQIVIGTDEIPVIS